MLILNTHFSAPCHTPSGFIEGGERLG